MKCLLDMDGVLVDFVSGVCQTHAIKNPYLLDKNLGNWNIIPMLGIQPHIFWKPLGEVFWSNLKPMHDYEQILRLIEKYNKDIYILTSPCPNDGCLTGKKNWIKKYLGHLLEKFVITSAKEVCAHDNAVLLDDFDHNINAFRKYGGHAHLVARPWNSRYKDTTLEALRESLDVAVSGV